MYSVKKLFGLGRNSSKMNSKDKIVASIMDAASLMPKKLKGRINVQFPMNLEVSTLASYTIPLRNGETVCAALFSKFLSLAKNRQSLLEMMILVILSI